jgi:hypothetical protein
MPGHCKTMLRVSLLVLLALFAAQFAGVWPGAAGADAAPNRPSAQEVPQKPPKKAVPLAPQQPQAAPAEPADASDAQQEQNDADMQRQLNDVRRQVEQEMLNRIRNGGSSWGFQSFMDDLAPVLGLSAFFVAVVWIIRVTLDNRRWNKMVKVQTETHAKLLDRFASSQEMLAYVQSEAGKKFLEAPMFEDQRRQVSILPFNRILWSVQVGIIVAVFGAGVLALRGRVPADSDLGFQVLGTLILTLGIGFLASGGVSYVLAKHFGLLERRDPGARSEHNA